MVECLPSTISSLDACARGASPPNARDSLADTAGVAWKLFGSSTTLPGAPGLDGVWS